MAGRTLQLHVRFTPAEFATLEAVRALHPVHSQADTIARLCRMECVRNQFDPGCAEALRWLDAEGQDPPSKAGRPATAAKVPQPPRPPQDPVQVGARFEHSEWTVRARAAGIPVVCEIVGVSVDSVSFRQLRQDGKGLAERVHQNQRSHFEAAHVGRWLDQNSGPGARAAQGPQKRPRTSADAGRMRAPAQRGGH